MPAVSAEPSPQVLREIPGRVRVHVTGAGGSGRLEHELGRLPGVLRVTVRAATENVLVEFDPRATSTSAILGALAAAGRGNSPRGSRTEPGTARPRQAAPTPPRADPRAAARLVSGTIREQAGRLRRARIAIPGIDRDPKLARRVVEALERRPDVRRAAASATTGRVLVEFSDRVTSVQDLLADLSSLDLPDIPEGDRPTHPLDPAPIVQSGARAIGTGLGLAALGISRVFGDRMPTLIPAAAVAGGLGIIDGSPRAREAIRHTLGRDRAQLLVGGATIASLTLSGSPLGLLLSGATAIRVYSEARLRRQSWREYEQRVAGAADAQPGAVVRLDTGARVPLRARVIDGEGTVIGGDGLPDGATAGVELPSGARVLRGPLVVELIGDRAWTPQPRPAPPAPGPLERYLALIGPAGAAYAIFHAVIRRSPAALSVGLLLVNPRTALIGGEAADTGASARVLRAGVTVVGTRPDRAIRRPDVLLVDGPRVLTDGLELSRLTPAGSLDRAALSELAGPMIVCSGAPWGAGPQLPRSGRPACVEDAEFDGVGVTATIGGRRLRLAPAAARDEDHPAVAPGREAGEETLTLRDTDSGELLGCVHLRPRIAPAVERLRERCGAAGIEIALLERDDRRASRAIARRADIPLILEADLVELVRERQLAGERVAVLSDSPAAAEAFEACDLAIGLSSGRSSQFAARADLLAPGLAAVTAIIDAALLREQAAAGAIGCSVAANVAGALWGLRGEPGIARASQTTYAAALAAVAGGWVRLHGGRRAKSIVSRLTDPRPERWGALSIEQTLAEVQAGPDGLDRAEALARLERRPRPRERNSLLAALGQQLESPLVAVLGVGAALSLAVGAVADVAIIGSVIVANAGVGAWQERQAGRAAAALHRMGAASARVVRDGAVVEVPAGEVVRGDVLILGSGDRVVADARLLYAEALEVDEASLTGESLPVSKSPDGATDSEKVLLEGSDVTVGTGRAVVVAVGSATRLGATAAALEVEESGESPLGRRLDRLFRQGLPIVAAGGVLVAVAGMLWGGAPLAQLAVGASVAVAAVPEGLPLLAGVAEASVARRLAGRQALVRRLSSVEGLGRVDVVCCDKTGTLTQGRLAVAVVDDLACAVRVSDGAVPASAAHVLEVAGLASPAPDASDARAHPTDGAILDAAEEAGIGQALRVARRAEAPFDPVRALHATATDGCIAVKGAAERLVDRCVAARAGAGAKVQLDDAGRAALLARAGELAGQGLRVLMVAEGPPGASVDDPSELTAIGFVGIQDPLRPGAAAAVRRCQEAGIRVVMLTGDHPATARAIASQAGIGVADDAVVTGDEIAALDNGALLARLEGVSVIARITPVDKLRIVDSLQHGGHTVAMTGDGVNDAPALRLADVGVAMGAGGTEVARQAADLVIADDRFETLTEALLEGRSLWVNLHHALGLLLGGNLGEMLLMGGAAVLGLSPVMTARQVLTVNLVTDVVPAVAVAIQAPGEQRLAEVGREGAESFDRRLMRDILHRGLATGIPALAVVLIAPAFGAAPQAVGFAAITITQLAQTVQAGRAGGGAASGPVLAGVGATGGVLAITLGVPPVRRFLGLPAPSVPALALSLATGPAAVAIASGLKAVDA